MTAILCAQVTADSKFADLGADSLDTVRAYVDVCVLHAPGGAWSSAAVPGVLLSVVSWLRKRAAGSLLVRKYTFCHIR